MKKIIQKEHKILRGIAKPVPINEIASPKIQKILTEMKEALDSQEDGVALAAPQIAESLQIFIVSHRAFELNEETPKNDEIHQTTVSSDENLIFINPEIIKLSKKKERMEEGCLSVRWLYGDVNRSTNATVQAYNEKGERFTRGAGGILAQIFQHEVDHLNGILFTDKAKDIQEILPQKQEKHEE